MMLRSSVSILVIGSHALLAAAFKNAAPCTRSKLPGPKLMAKADEFSEVSNQGPLACLDRRSLLRGFAVASGALAARPAAWAVDSETLDRTTGYQVKRSASEWRSLLRPAQYEVLREGGTERPFTSPLESEKRAGTFVCAGCGAPLFTSDAKFKSGTGWPSFATALPAVEVAPVSSVRRALLGAELRCGKCGGHLGDVFDDGKAFPGTPAFKSGARHCIDGAALVFLPQGGGIPVAGDAPSPSRPATPGFLEPPKITPREMPGATAV